MVLIEKSKIKHLVSCKIGKKIISILINEFFNCLGCVEEDKVWCSFEIMDLVSQVLEDTYIQTKDRYAGYIRMLIRLEVKKKVFLKLANVKKDKKEEKS